MKKGARFSDEHRKNLSKNHADVSGENNPMFGVRRFGADNPMFGKRHKLAAKVKMSLANSGENGPMFGKTGVLNHLYDIPLSDDHKRKISESSKGEKNHNYAKHPSEATIIKMRDAALNKPPASEATRAKRRAFGKTLVGEKNPAWKGGITPFVIQIRNSIKYDIWRLGVFTRDDFTCCLCGVRGGKLHADHYLRKFSTILEDNGIKTLEQAYACEELWDLNNGRTLCVDCHKEHHGREK